MSESPVCVSLCVSPRGRSAPKSSSEQGSSSDKKERPMSTMSEASNYTGGSDYSTFTGSPATTVTPAITTSTSSTRVSLYLITRVSHTDSHQQRQKCSLCCKFNQLFQWRSPVLSMKKRKWAETFSCNSSFFCFFDAISDFISTPSHFLYSVMS